MFIIHICFGEALFSLMEKKKQTKTNGHTVSPEYAGLHQTNYGVQTTKCICLSLQSIVYDQIEEKLSNYIYQAILKDFRLKNIDCTKYQLIFVTAEEISSKTFLF